MGHSVSCLYDYRTDDYIVYFNDNIDRMVERINEADLVVNFNGKGFDHKLLNACPQVKVKLRPDIDTNVYDMLEVSRKSVGWHGGKFPSGLKLDQHLEIMYGKNGMKSGNGEMAPKLWQQRKLGELTSYCIRDVKCERMLFESAWYEGQFATEAHGLRDVERPQLILYALLKKRDQALGQIINQSGAV